LANHTLALRHQFDNVEQQKDASTLGMWIFLITEIMFFGGMFLAYTIYRSAYPTLFATASSFQFQTADKRRRISGRGRQQCRNSERRTGRSRNPHANSS